MNSKKVKQLEINSESFENIELNTNVSVFKFKFKFDDKQRYGCIVNDSLYLRNSLYSLASLVKSNINAKEYRIMIDHFKN